MAKRKTKFKKIYCLDTNIILNEADNIFTLSDNGDNLIVLPETVLDEIDVKKTGLSEIAYQAREFGRIYSDAEVLQVDRASNKKLVTIHSKAYKDGRYVYIDVISKKKYDSANDTSIDPKIRNDRKIIEIARDVQTENNNTIFISLDTMARNRALSIGLDVQTINTNTRRDIVLSYKLCIEKPAENYSIFDIYSMDVPKTVQHLEITSKDGKPFYYYKTGNLFVLIDEASLKKQEVPPINMGQKVLMSQMLDEYYDVVISDSPAGSGKTLQALSAAMKLIDTHKGKYDKIVYIRKTVLSDDEELGFLKGSLDEKMAGFLAPLYSNLQFIVEKKYKNRKSKLTQDEIDLKVIELKNKYQIQFKYQGHLRGDNIRNAVIICDEQQNDLIKGLRTILTRVSENCKAFVLGSTKQIDSKYVNKYNNALTYLLNQIGEDTKNVRLTGFNLDKTVRSAIADWADDF